MYSMQCIQCKNVNAQVHKHEFTVDIKDYKYKSAGVIWRCGGGGIVTFLTKDSGLAWFFVGTTSKGHENQSIQDFLCKNF